MIVFDESEHYKTPLEEDTLRILLNFLPRDVYDKLLNGGDDLVRINHRVRTRRMEERCEPVIDWDSLISATPASEGKSKAETPLPVDVRQRFRSS